MPQLPDMKRAFGDFLDLDRESVAAQRIGQAAQMIGEVKKHPKFNRNALPAQPLVTMFASATEVELEHRIFSYFDTFYDPGIPRDMLKRQIALMVRYRDAFAFQDQGIVLVRQGYAASLLRPLLERTRKGQLPLINTDELVLVMAHELGHVQGGKRKIGKIPPSIPGLVEPDTLHKNAVQTAKDFGIQSTPIQLGMTGFIMFATTEAGLITTQIGSNTLEEIRADIYREYIATHLNSLQYSKPPDDILRRTIAEYGMMKETYRAALCSYVAKVGLARVITPVFQADFTGFLNTGDKVFGGREKHIDALAHLVELQYQLTASHEGRG